MIRYTVTKKEKKWMGKRERQREDKIERYFSKC